MYCFILWLTEAIKHTNSYSQNRFLTSWKMKIKTWSDSTAPLKLESSARSCSPKKLYNLSTAHGRTPKFTEVQSADRKEPFQRENNYILRYFLWTFEFPSKKWTRSQESSVVHWALVEFQNPLGNILTPIILANKLFGTLKTRLTLLLKSGGPGSVSKRIF